MTDRRRFQCATLISLFIHFSVIAWLSAQHPNRPHAERRQTKPQAEARKSGGHEHQPLSVEVIPKPPEKKVDRGSQEKSEKGTQPKTTKKEKCQKSYEGIGITSILDEAAGTQRVSKVHEGYPAEKAGLQKGDVVEVVGGGKIRGPKGTVVTLKVERNGETFFLDVTRDKICHE